MATRRIFFCFLTTLLVGQLTVAQEVVTDTIPTIKIVSSRIAQNLDSYTSAISVVDVPKLNPQQNLSVNEYLSEIPGLFALNANNFAQDSRVSIRGFGARSSFGIRGIKLIVDGIPETTPDGQGQVDNLILSSIDKVEVLRGPSSSLYGNASGGVIHLTSAELKGKPNSALELTAGSFGMYSLYGQTEFQLGESDWLLQMGHSTSDGYRDRSGFKNTQLGLKMNFKPKPGARFQVNVSYTDSPEALDAGGLNLSEVQTDRRQARDRNILFEAGESIKHFKLGARYEDQISEDLSFDGYIFVSTRDFYGRLPFENGGIVDLKRTYYGLGGHFDYQQALPNGWNKLQIGYDWLVQGDQRDRFVNMEGIQGNQTFDQKESFTSFSLYALDHLRLGKLSINAGIRTDWNLLKVEDHFTSNGDDSGERTLHSVNPSLGFNFQLNPEVYVFANVSKSFETPVLSELSANPTGQGGFNLELDPQRATGYEAGFRGRIGRRIQYELLYFYIRTKDEIIPFESQDFPGRDFYRNAGQTIRKGIEGSFTLNMGSHWIAKLTNSLGSFKFDEYLIDGEDLKDNRLSGIPNTNTSFSLRYVDPNGWKAGIQMTHTGLIYATDNNSIDIPRYSVVNFSLGRAFESGKIRWFPSFGIQNVGDTDYFDNVRINAFGGRYYEPAPQMNYFFGLRAEF